MATQYKTRGFVFKRQDRNEADRVFSIFTEDYGRLEIFAKAIRKMPSKLRAGIDAFCLSEIEFVQGKHHKTLTDARVLRRYVQPDASSLMWMQRISNVLDEGLHGPVKEAQLFSLLQEVFTLKENVPVATQELLYGYFVWNFFAIQGKTPELFRCIRCKKPLQPNGLYFSYHDGGTVHAACRQANDISLDSHTVKVLRLMIQRNWKVLSRLTMEDAIREMVSRVSQAAVIHFA